MKKLFIMLIAGIFLTSINMKCYAQKSAADILREGLLGAGTGAIAGAVSGADGNDLWKGALAGAGVNIIGGSVLDIISSNNGNTAHTRRQRVVYAAPATSYAVPRNTVTYQGYTQPMQQQQAYYSDNSYGSAYEQGYAEGFKAGYTKGYKEGLGEGLSQ